MNVRSVVAAITLLIGFAAMSGGIGFAAPSPLTVSSLPPPAPPATEPGSELLVLANVKARTAFGPAAQVTFYLANAPKSGPADIAIGTATVPLLEAIFGESISTSASVPQDVTPGFYYLLACSGNSCAATPGTIHVIGQALSAVDQAPGTAQASAPATEYFPENPGDGMTVDSPFDCPLSAHGQWPSRCVWVNSPVISAADNIVAKALMYCPRSNPFPYQVALGFDPLWQDKSVYPVSAQTSGVSRIKYKVENNGRIFSYSGRDPNDPAQRGYAFFLFYCGEHSCPSFKGQVRFLCSDKASTSSLP